MALEPTKAATPVLDSHADSAGTPRTATSATPTAPVRRRRRKVRVTASPYCFPPGSPVLVGGPEQPLLIGDQVRLGSQRHGFRRRHGVGVLVEEQLEADAERGTR